MKRLIASSSIAGAATIMAACALSAAPAFAHSALAASSTTTQLPSATTLSLSWPFASYGDEQAEDLSVTVGGAGSTPTGTVTITAGLTTVCTVSLTDGAGSCALTATELDPAAVNLVASYSGDATFAPSAAAQVLYVSAPTTIKLSLSPAAVTVFAPAQSEQLTVTVAAPGGFTPGGTVLVEPNNITSTGACGQINLAPSGVPGTAIGTCTVTVYEDGFGVKPYFYAQYAGDPYGGFGGSSVNTVLTVLKDPTTTTLRLSAPKIVYGHEQSERATVTLAPKYPAELYLDDVTVWAGSKALCVINVSTASTVAQHTASCLLPASALAAGKPALTASFAGDSWLGSSSSASARVTVTKAAAKVAFKWAASTVVYGHEKSEKFSVTVSPQYAGALSGTVTIETGRTVLCRITLKNGKRTGTCSPSAKALRAGRYTITAVFSGNGDYSGATYRKSYLTVKR